MKKILTAILALVLSMSLSVTAFAASAGAGTATRDAADLDSPLDIDVAGYYDGTAPAGVYSVSLSWGSMTFKYSTDGTAEWNPQTHSYDVGVNAGWESVSPDPDAATVTVTNHSNKPVSVALAFAPVANAAALGDYTGTITVPQGKNQLAAATEGSAYDEADALTGTLTLNGRLNLENTQGIQLGTVTVTLDRV